MSRSQLDLFGPAPSGGPRHHGLSAFKRELAAFDEFGKPTIQTVTEVEAGPGGKVKVETFVNEFWTSKQRQAHSLHEVSYRACFKPQLPRFFIQRLTDPGDTVYDPFMGRGTTPVEAALMGRIAAGCDVNPLSRILTAPRLSPPTQGQIAERLGEVSLEDHGEFPEELLVFYHPETLQEICALKQYLLKREERRELDAIDNWIRMVAINRLTGHSVGFFSVYTMPPNQAVSVKSQRKINEKRDQTPPRRDVRQIILRKSRSLLSKCDDSTRAALSGSAGRSLFLTQDCSATPEIPTGSVALAVTSPPFLDVVDYATDNWLRCWFCGIDAEEVPITIHQGLEKWASAMTRVLVELARVLRPGGYVAFEVGEVKKGTVALEEQVLSSGVQAGLEPALVLINDQQFTKTSHCWGVDNRQKGTNTNRIVLFGKPEEGS